MSTAGVFIKLNDPDIYQPDEIAAKLFGPFESKDNEWTSGFDSRLPEHKIISVCEKGINISDAQLVEQILVKGNEELIRALYKLFEQPKTMFSYMHYDSSDSFGFRYIEDGWTKRYRYKWGGMQTVEDGTPLPEELKILNAELFFQGDIEDEDLCYYTDKLNGYYNAYHFMSSALASEVMKTRIGFDFQDEDITYHSTFYTYTKTVNENLKKKEDNGGFFTKVFGRKT